MSISKIDLIKLYKQKTALVIDDYPDMRGSIRRMLQNFGVPEVDTASDGSEAIRRCERRHYDIILADYNLGESKNGQQVLEELRLRQLIRHSGIYMMITAETTTHMVFGALEYQPDDYLTKPFTQGVLEKRLNRLLIEKQALEDIHEARAAGDFEKAITLSNERIQLRDRYEQKYLQLLAQSLYDMQDYAAAKAIYVDVMLEREMDWAAIGLSKCMLALDELDQVEQLLGKLINDGCRCLEVYDDMAEVKVRRGDMSSAQQVLLQAIEISPHAFNRQELLAQVSEKKQDWELAEKARKKVLRLGNNSVFENPENHFKLVRCLNEAMQADGNNNKLKDIQETLRKAKRKYHDRDDIGLQCDILETSALANAGTGSINGDTLKSLQQRLEKTSQQPAQLLLDMAQAYRSLDEHDSCQALLISMSQTYAEQTDICDAIDKLADEPLSDKGKKHAIELNSKGKSLFEGKHYEEAIALFDEALGHYPNNIGLNLNMMLALIRHMSEAGPDTKLLDRCTRAMQKLGHLKTDNPMYDRYKVLSDHYEKLKASA